MRRWWLTLLLLVAAAIVWRGLSIERDVGRRQADRHLRAVITWNPRLGDPDRGVLAAWRSVLQEEGFPVEPIDLYRLADLAPDRLAARVPVLILPDGVCRSVPSSFKTWLESYLDAGGLLLAVYDPAVATLKGGYLPRGFLARLSGVSQLHVLRDGDAAFTRGRVRFRSPAARRRCGIPPGKVDAEGYLCGYGYGRLDYPVARADLLPGRQVELLAEAVTTAGDTVPALTLSRWGAGRVLWVNLPLGWLKGRADDLPLRALARLALGRLAGLPHLVAAPGGVGTVIVNWHVDFSDDRPALEEMLERGLLRRDLPASIHICAGPDVNAFGDGDGFAACGAGSTLVRRLLPYGTIGSHGGWIHNLFASRVDGRLWGADSIRTYVARNRDCLARVTGRPVVEYSAPAGVFPPRTMLPLLREMGFTAFYYTGDSGSAPNRTFHAGRALSDSLIAFPVMPRQEYASLAEMDMVGGLPADSVAAWLRGVADYCARERTIRMVYSHPYNLQRYTHDVDYRPVWSAWLDTLAARRARGELQVRTMSDCADFLRRLWRTELRCALEGGEARLTLRNPAGLRDVTVELPRDRFVPPDTVPPGCRLRITPEAVLLTVEDGRRELEWSIHVR